MQLKPNTTGGRCQAMFVIYRRKKQPFQRFLDHILRVFGAI